MKKRILFRCDGGSIPEIGTGHVTRCLLLADELKKYRGNEVAFLANEGPCGAQRVRSQGYPVYGIEANEDIGKKTIEAISHFRPDIVSVDCLATDADYMRHIKETGVLLVTLDDSGAGRAFADIRINPIVGVDDSDYEGYEYLALAPINTASRRHHRNGNNVFVCFGGFDCSDITEKFLRIVNDSDIPAHFHVVVGEPYDNLHALKDRYRDNKGISLYQNPSHFLDLLSQSDIAVVSGGLTLFQAVSNGIPTITIPQYEHQVKTAKKLEALGVAINAGMLPELNSQLLVDRLRKWLHENKRRPPLPGEGRELIDGLGTMRVAESMAIVNKLEWDSNFFNMNIATLCSPKVNEKTMAFAFAKCKEADIDCLYYICNSRDFTCVRLAEGYRFNFIDMKMIFEYSVRATEETDLLKRHNDIVIRIAKTEDIDAVQQIPEEGYVYSRYFLDEHFPRHLCTKFYRDWIEKSVKGMFDDIVLVAEVDNTIAGYISCRTLTSNMGIIGLVAVSQEYRGRHVGRVLFQSGLQWFKQQGIPRVQCTTQGRNIPMQRLLQGCGFKVMKNEMWYHKWFSDDTCNYTS